MLDYPSSGARVREVRPAFGRQFPGRAGARWMCCLALLLLLPPAAIAGADDWRGRLGGSWAWNEVSGSEDAYRSQFNLQEGFALDDFELTYQGEGGPEEFWIEARGFGSALPYENARLGLRFASGVEISIDYDRRQSFFRLEESDLGLRSDDWDITRWNATVAVDAWKPVLASLTLRRYERDGTVYRPLYGLNELYPVGVAVDEGMTEGSILLETRTLPVKFEFEQTFARYERKNRRFAAGEEAINRPDPDLLADTSTDFTDTQDVPTTRLTASYASSRFDGVATVLYADADLDAGGTGQTAFAIGGGAIGTMAYIDELTGSAQTETLFGALSLGFRLSPKWIVRLTADARDARTDATLLGQRLIRATSPSGGMAEFGATVDKAPFYDVHDATFAGRVEYRAATWSAWVGGTSGSRKVIWDRDVGDYYSVTRDSDGLLIGAEWSPGRYLNTSLEYEQGDFTRFVFRTDPETVDRMTFKLRSQLGKGWSLGAHARWEEASNPEAEAGLDHQSSPYGATLSWAAKDGVSNAGLMLERADIRTETGLVLPTGTPDVSIYDLDAMTTSLYGQTRVGIVALRGSATRVTDDGSTWPMDSWAADVRASLSGPLGLDYGLFVEYWSYDEDLAERDDYDLTRVGVSILWRFE